MARKHHPVVPPAPGRAATPDGPAAARNLRRMIGPQPTIYGEDDRDFDLLHRELIEELGPQGLIEHLLVKDIADATWQIQRADRFLKSLVAFTLPEAARQSAGVALHLKQRPSDTLDAAKNSRIAQAAAATAHLTLSGLASDWEFTSLLESAGMSAADLAAVAAVLEPRAVKLLDDRKLRYAERRRLLLRDLDLRQTARGAKHKTVIVGKPKTSRRSS